MRRTVTIFLACIMAFSIALTGCSGGSPAPAGTETQAGTAASDGPKNLTIGAGRTFWQGPDTNIYIHGTTNVWESLVRLNNDMEPQYELAEDIAPSKDGLAWTIKLKKGVKFHDGTEFDAETAKYNLDRLYHFNAVVKKYDQNYKRSDDFGSILSMNAVDKYTLEVKHEKPIPDFPARLAYECGAMFSKASFDQDGRITAPYGTGPYKYKSYDDKNQILYLEKYKEYRLGEPKLDSITFKNIPDASTRLAALQSGEIDAVADVGAVLPQQASKIKADTNLELKERLVSTVHYFCLNSNEGKLFSDSRMRNALSYATDRQSIVDGILQGYGKKADSVLSEASKGWVKACAYSFDPEKAKTLKTQAVGDKTVSAVLLINASLVGRWPYQDVAQLMQSQLAKIGVEVKIETVDAATWSKRLKQGEYDIAPQPYTVSSGEPNFFFATNMLSTGTNNVNRSYGINDKSLDELVRKVETEPEKTKRQQYYNQLQDIAKESAYIIPVWDDVTLYAVNKKVKNFELDVTFWPNLYKVDMK